MKREQLKAINVRMIELKAEMAELDRLKEKISVADELILRANERLTVARAQYDTEINKLHVAKEPNLAAVLRFLVTGGEEVSVKTEEQNVAIARAQYDSCFEACKALMEDRERFVQQLPTFASYEKEYLALVKEKSTLIAESKSPHAARFFELSENCAKCKAEMKEIGEAVEAGRATSIALFAIEREISDVLKDLKYRKLGAIRHAILEAQNKFHRFQIEIRDIKLDTVIEPGDFMEFSKGVIEVLTLELVTPERLQLAVRNMRKRGEQIESVVQNLNTRLKKVDDDLSAYSIEWRETVELFDEDHEDST